MLVYRALLRRDTIDSRPSQPILGQSAPSPVPWVGLAYPPPPSTFTTLLHADLLNHSKLHLDERSKLEIESIRLEDPVLRPPVAGKWTASHTLPGTWILSCATRVYQHVVMPHETLRVLLRDSVEDKQATATRPSRLSRTKLRAM